jgi:3-dehydrosphinganine reductase
LGKKAIIHVGDVMDRSSLDEVAAELRERRIELDILVNSAGIVHPVPLMEQTAEEIEATILTNLLGCIHSCRAFIPLMRRGGYIANISSIAGLVGLYGYTSYSASKFGVLGLSEALALELSDRGIRVGTVFPPDTDTPQLKEELKRRPEQLSRMAGAARPLPSDKVAAAVVNGIIRGKAMVYPSVIGRLLRLTSGKCGPFIRWYLRRKLHA